MFLFNRNFKYAHLVKKYLLEWHFDDIEYFILKTGELKYCVKVAGEIGKSYEPKYFGLKIQQFKNNTKVWLPLYGIIETIDNKLIDKSKIRQSFYKFKWKLWKKKK